MTGVAVAAGRKTAEQESLLNQIRGEVGPETEVRADEPLAKRTTLRVGGLADVFVVPAHEADLAAVLRVCAATGTKFFVLGRGSNLLIRDGGIRGVVLALTHENFSRVTVVDTTLHCGAGAKLKQVAVSAKRAGLSGMEFLEGIPGSVGGALRMNAGAMGRETFQAVKAVRLMDYCGEIRTLAAAEVPVQYRACALLQQHIALGAVFQGEPQARAGIEATMNAYSRKRWSSQPAAPSAGCCFKNPPEVPAGKLVDELGLKGTKIGGAMVSLEHGNFITNDGTATARNVLDLMALIQAKAQAERGIALQPEVEIIGED